MSENIVLLEQKKKEQRNKTRRMQEANVYKKMSY